MPTDEAAKCFLNVDLDLTFDGDISPLILAFGSSLIEMHRQEGFASFELSDLQPRSADAAIGGFWRLVQALSPEMRAIWDACRSRTLNVGVQAPAAKYVEFAVSRESVDRVRELGADIVLTVYPRAD